MTEQAFSPIERVLARQGEILRRWGPIPLDPVTLSRFAEAEGWPSARGDGTVSPAILLQLGNAPVDVHNDQRPHETIDPGLKNPINGGTAVWWSRPVRPGEIVSGEVSLKTAFTRQGKAGPLGFVVVQTRFLGTGAELIGRAEKTIIFRDGA
jgi:N-terminal half of MaoC dehydratase